MRDNKDQNSNVGHSPLLSNFTKKAAKSQYVSPIYTHRSASKIYASNSNSTQIYSIHNRQAFTQTSRKKVQPPQTQLQQRYQQIQKILMNQNQNLKKQNEYLASEIRQVAKKEKQLRKQLQQTINRSTQQQDQIMKLEDILSQLKVFIQQNIHNLALLLQVNSLTQIKNSLTSFLQGLSIILCLENSQKANLKETNQNNNIHQFNFQSIDKEIEQLSVKLQQMLKQNNSSCRDPNVRRQCIQIAKQIKQLQKKKKDPHLIKEPLEANSFDNRKNFVPKHTRVYSTNHQKTAWILQQCLAKKEQSDDKFKYPKQIYCKVTNRRNGSGETKLLHINSMGSMFNKKEKQ